ncbi:uncharacterized protein PAC_14790 [Phialocephala subalpina]|uniref:Uncharacterized protein n=1 Tax=Phialocephala subalpina TaxID=576137 RepID=A0A1L7XIM2_9HELO|nr:uncharacterized protein PAC_14790 [Phialocephala subalpina]
MERLEEFNLSTIDCLVGIVKVKLSTLSFLGGREIDPQITTNLIKIFTYNSRGCDRNTEGNYIPAILNLADLQTILYVNGLAREHLNRTIYDKSYRPLIHLGQAQLNCLHGKHRIEAAKSILSHEEDWWIVKLFCFNSDSMFLYLFLKITNPADCLAAGFILKQGESFSHQTKFSDGEIYRKIRYHQKQKNYDLVQDWMLHLSEWKQKHLRQMFRHKSFITAFDKLLCFPGLWSGLELGNIRRHLALRCHEELLSYLEHVYRTWEEITQLDPLFCRAVDIYTVQNLQMRAPLASSADRDHIIQCFSNDQLIFSKVTDIAHREKIKQTILQLPVIIPTIKSFHENVKYLEPAAKIIKKQLFGNRVPYTIYQALSSIWRSTGRAIVEVREGQFKFVQVSLEDSMKDIAYVQVFLSAFRNFPRLSYDAPRKEKGEPAVRGMPNDTVLYQFLQRVQLLGFHSSKIDEKLNGSRQPLALGLERVATIRRGGESLERRWGRPFEASYKYFRERLFLGRSHPLELDINPSIMFVQQNLLAAFFGYTSVNFQANTTADLAPIPTQQLPTWTTYAPIPDCPGTITPIPTSSEVVPLVRTGPNPEITQPVPTEAPVTEQSTGLVEDYGPPRDTPSSPGTVATIETIIPLDTMASPEFANTRTWISPEMQDLTSLINTAMEVDGASPSQDAQSIASQEEYSHNQGETIHIEPSLDGVSSGQDSTQTCPVDANTISHVADEMNASKEIIEATPTDVMSEPELEAIEEAESISDTSTVVGRIDEEVESISDSSTVVGTADEEDNVTDLPSQAYDNDRVTAASQKRRSYLTFKPQRPSAIRGSKGRRSYLAPNTKSAIPQSRLPGMALQGRRSFLIRKPGKSAESRIPQSPRVRSPGRSQQPSRPRSYMLAELNKLQQGVQSSAKPLNRSQGRRSYLVPSTNETVRPETPHIVKFIEHNGMIGSLKATRNIADHLQQRKGWVGMIIERAEAKTIRFDHIVGYIANGNLGESRTLALVKESYAEIFRTSPMRHLRYIDG